jgi:hypothetical protein
VAWVSDFAEPETMRPALRQLRRRGYQCVGWLPETEDDRAPSADGHVLFADPETGRQEVMQVDAALREAMAEELRALSRMQGLVFGRAGFMLRRYRLPIPGDRSLSSWLGGFAGNRAVSVGTVARPGPGVSGPGPGTESWLAHI